MARNDSTGTVLDLTSQSNGDTVIVTPMGEVDAATAAQLRTALATPLERGLAVIVDLSDVSFVDSTTLGVLIAIHRRACAEHRPFVVILGNTRFERLFQITQLDHFLTVVGTVSEALGRVAAGEV